MSSQRGNTKRTREQKYSNKSVFKNDMHNKTQQMASINRTELPGLCLHCKEKIEWKIKYAKYKPLTVAKKCVKCSENNIKRAYYVMCIPCGSANNVCCKCGEAKEIVLQEGLTTSEHAAEDAKLQQTLKYLKERERRTFFRLQEQKKSSGDILGVKGQDKKLTANLGDNGQDSDCSDCIDSDDDSEECTTSDQTTDQTTDQTECSNACETEPKDMKDTQLEKTVSVQA